MGEWCTTKPAAFTYLLLDTTADFTEAVDALVAMGWHGTLTFGTDLNGQPDLTLTGMSSQEPGVPDASVVQVARGNVLRWSSCDVKRYDDIAAFHAENDIT